MKKILLILLLAPVYLTAQNLRKWSSDSTTNTMWGNWFYRSHPSYGVGDSLKLADKKYVDAAVGSLNDSFVVLLAPTAGNDMKLFNNQTTAGFAGGVFYPNNGTNVTSTLAVVPRGTANPSNKAGINIFETDFFADGTNSSYLSIASTGTSNDVMSAAAGTGTVRPIRIFTGSNTQLVINTNGTNDITGNTTLMGQLFVTTASGAGESIKIFNPKNTANVAQLLAIPGAGTNIATDFIVSPKGTGLSNSKASVIVYENDVEADNTNTSFIGLRTNGSLGVLATGKSGTGTARPLMFAAGWLTDLTTNANQLRLETSGNVLIGTSTDGGEKFQVNGSVALDLGSDATGDIYYRNSGGSLTRLGVGSNGNILTLASGLPSWSAPTSTTALKGTTNWTPGIVAAGSSATTTVSVTGAALGDPVTISKTSGAYSNGEVYDAFVSATNTVTIRVHNVSTGSANYSSAADYNVIVLKY